MTDVPGPDTHVIVRAPHGARRDGTVVAADEHGVRLSLRKSAPAAWLPGTRLVLQAGDHALAVEVLAGVGDGLWLHPHGRLEERRAFPRRQSELPARWAHPTTSGDGVVLDLSLGGCRLTSKVPLPTDSALLLSIELEPGESVDAVAEVRAHQAGAAGAHHHSVEFVAVTADGFETLRAFVAGEPLPSGGSAAGIAD